MYKRKTLENILFLDIETVACVADYNELDESLKYFWDKKAAFWEKTEPQEIRELFFDKAAIYAEFGKVIAIGLGYIMVHSEGQLDLRVKCLHNHNEKILLQSLQKVLETKFQQETLVLCAHNGKEFDFPYLCRRMLVNGITLPQILDTSGKKPWEVNHLDTMEMWKFGDRKNFTPLDLLATLFNIKSSKREMDGSKVSHCYYINNDLEKIKTYCMQDVVVTAQVFLKMNHWECVQTENITFI